MAHPSASELGMKMNDVTRAPENNQIEGVSRRSLVKSAAWAVPVIAFAAPVPAYAASPRSTKNGLRAKFKAWYTRESNKNYIDLIGLDSQHPATGYEQITGVVVGQVVTNVSVYAYIDKNIDDSSWAPRNYVGENYWKKPVKVAGPDAGGYYTYRIDYKTVSTPVTIAGTLELDARFHFRAPFGNGGSVKVKGSWTALVSPSATPALNVSSTNIANLDSNGEYVYLTAPGS